MFLSDFPMLRPVHIIGGGLAGSEAAWQLACRGVPVILHEMRPLRKTPAHQTDGLAELVCSNSLRSDDPDHNAVGLLHEEMRRCGSLVMRAADSHKVPAGGALAVDRDAFSKEITETLASHPLVTIERGEITSFPEEWDQIIVASGPLTSDALAATIQTMTGAEHLHFFDALAPIVERESIDMSKAWMQSRYDKGDGSDYINCAMDKAQYEAFIEALLAAEKTEFKDWEKNTPYFEGCLPIEVMAARGKDTLRYGPLKPVGLTNPHDPSRRPYAVLQLRQDNASGTLWNIVGFQTKMTYGAQQRVFRMIPGLENAVFARLGGIHRNSFIKSPELLDEKLRLKRPRHPSEGWGPICLRENGMPACAGMTESSQTIRFAGQVMGVEGYVESASMGLLAGLFAAADRLGKDIPSPPRETALGALLAHVTGEATSETFQPMNVTFGLFPPLDQQTSKGIQAGHERGAERVSSKGGKSSKAPPLKRKAAQAQRAKDALGVWLAFLTVCFQN